MYPVQCFHCKDISEEKIERIFRDCVTIFGNLGIFAGPVHGETGIPGLLLDFNCGLRLEVPEGNWHICISDAESGLIFYDQDVSCARLESIEKYYVPWQIDAWLDGEQVFSHTFNPRGQRVHFVCCSRGMGDNLAFLPYIRAFQRYWQADVSYYVRDWLQSFTRRYYPDIPLLERGGDDTYATFYFNMGIDQPYWLPMDGRQLPMDQIGQVMLRTPQPVKVATWQAKERKIKEPYVCIGVQASGAFKGWHYPGGWDIVVRALKDVGYRVLCIDKNREQSDRGYTSVIPEGAEDFTGDIPLDERADMLAHAEFFVGLGSGLSWLANLVGCPVVMICGFSYYWYEFSGSYRVYNPLSCHGCFNDKEVSFIESTCPYHHGDPDRELECMKKISPKQVLLAVEKLLRDKEKGLL